MESNVLTSIPGIEYYPIISLIMFFVLFAGLLLWFFLADRKQLEDYARAPFDFEDHSIDHDARIAHDALSSTETPNSTHASSTMQTYA